MDLTIHWFGGPFGLRHDHKCTGYGTADRDRHEAAEATEAGATGLEPATSGVTGRRSNQLSYAPKWRGIGV
jgi:hypothetical protein